MTTLALIPPKSAYSIHDHTRDFAFPWTIFGTGLPVFIPVYVMKNLYHPLCQRTEHVLSHRGHSRHVMLYQKANAYPPSIKPRDGILHISPYGRVHFHQPLAVQHFPTPGISLNLLRGRTPVVEILESNGQSSRIQDGANGRNEKQGFKVFIESSK